VVDGLAEPRIGSGAGQGGGRTEVIQCPEHVVPPSVRMREAQKLLVGRFAGTETTEEAALQHDPTRGQDRTPGAATMKMPWPSTAGRPPEPSMQGRLSALGAGRPRSRLAVLQAPNCPAPGAWRRGRGAPKVLKPPVSLRSDVVQPRFHVLRSTAACFSSGRISELKSGYASSQSCSTFCMSGTTRSSRTAVAAGLSDPISSGSAG
jgi:hypothetical protein